MELEFKFRSINQLRKDITGYHVDYILKVDFCYDLFCGTTNDAILVSRQSVKSFVIDTVLGKNLISLFNPTDLVSFSKWVNNRLCRVFPKKNIFVNHFVLSDGVESIYVTIAKGNKDKIILCNNQLIDSSGSIYISVSTKQRKAKAIEFILNSLALRSNTGVNKFTTKTDTKQVMSIMLSDGCINLVTFICPPYINKPQKGYCGLFASVYEDPGKYNFDYNYSIPFEVLENMTKIGNKIKVKMKGVICYCDHGLINIQGIKNTLPTDVLIRNKLDTFWETLKDFANRYPRVSVVRLSDWGVSNYLPLGLPFSHVERKIYIESLIRGSKYGNVFNFVDKKLLTFILKWVSDKNLIWSLDWNNFASVGTNPDTKRDFTNIIKTYGNIAWMRARQRNSSAVMEDLLSENNCDLRLAAFYDALLRHVEYRIYGGLASNHVANPVCVYQDPGFPVAGHHFRNKNFPVLFIDPEKAKNVQVS